MPPVRFLERGLHQPALLFDMTTMELLPETGYTHMHGYLGVFAVRGGRFALAFQQPETSLAPYVYAWGREGGARSVRPILPEPLRCTTSYLEPWALRVFSTESMAPTPVQVTAQRHAAGLTIQIDNRGALPLQGATVVYRGKMFPLGVIAPGEVRLDDLYLALQSAESAQETTWRVLLKRRAPEADSRLAYFQEVLLQQYFGDKRLAEVSETPFLAGWLMAPTTLSPASEAWPVQGVTLVVSRFML